MTEQALPFLTGGVSGIGGVVRAVPEDFRAEEPPLYLPRGEGEPLYLRVTKRGLSTREMVSCFSSALGVKARCIGVAGLKDANAVTTQMVSVQGTSPELLSRLQKDSRILSVEALSRHRNRLRTGHHAGNVFQLAILDVHPSATGAAPLILEELSRRGVPNYFGPQRQGPDGLNYTIGASLPQVPPLRAGMPRAKRLLFLPAHEAFLLNRSLAGRIGH